MHVQDRLLKDWAAHSIILHKHSIHQGAGAVIQENLTLEMTSLL